MAARKMLREWDAGAGTGLQLPRNWKAAGFQASPWGAKSWDSLYGSSWIQAVSGVGVSAVGFWRREGAWKVARGGKLRPAQGGGSVPAPLAHWLCDETA